MYHCQTSLNCGVPSLTGKNSIKHWQENSVIVVFGEGWAGMCSSDSYALSVGDSLYCIIERLQFLVDWARRVQMVSELTMERAISTLPPEQIIPVIPCLLQHTSHVDRVFIYVQPNVYLIQRFIRFVYSSSVQSSDKVYFQCKYT